MDFSMNRPTLSVGANMRERDYEEDEDDDWENPEADDDSDDESTALYDCPECGAEVYEDCEQCPSCRQYITPRSRSRFAPGSSFLTWAAILALLGVIAVACFVFL